MSLSLCVRFLAICGLLGFLKASDASAQLLHRHHSRSFLSCSIPIPTCAIHIASGGQPAIAGSAVGDIDRPEQDFAASTVDQEINYAMDNHPLLAGAWLKLVSAEPSADGSSFIYKFKRILDQSRAAEQTAAMDRLIATWVPARSQIIFEAPQPSYPLTELVSALQSRIEVDMRFDGCFVEDGRYVVDSNDEEKLNLVLLGRVASPAQRELLEAECTTLMKSIPAWVGSKASSVRQVSYPVGSASLGDVSLAITPIVNEDLKVVQGSRTLAAKWNVIGLKHFQDGRYAEASRTFQLAIIEAPELVEYRYWRIMSDLALGRTDSAYRQMRNVAKNPNIDKYSVHKVMERVQGPLRQELRALEQRVMHARTRGY